MLAAASFAGRHPKMRILASRVVSAATRPARSVVIDRYLDRHAVRRLVLGSGIHRRRGWLSSDLLPVLPSTIFLNATKLFPLPTASFDLIFCEHMIEHLDLDGAERMLRECRRVLRAGGILRIATPDLERFTVLPGQPLDDMTKRYVRWANVSAGAPMHDLENPVYAFNQMMRAWGHTFLYDDITLRRALERSGFEAIIRCQPGQSAVPALCNLERHGSMIGEEFNRFETMVLEARHDTAPSDRAPVVAENELGVGAGVSVLPR